MNLTVAVVGSGSWGTAVAALTAVGFFADRLNAGLARDARSLLIRSSIVLADEGSPFFVVSLR